jgi:hypothetical protein
MEPETTDADAATDAEVEADPDDGSDETSVAVGSWRRAMTDVTQTVARANLVMLRT